MFLGFRYPSYALGAWDDVLETRDQLPHDEWVDARPAYGPALRSAVPVCVHRGRLEEARRMAADLPELERSADVQERCYYGVASAEILLAEGEAAEALRVAKSAFAERSTLGIAHDTVKEAFALALEAALELQRLDEADELLAVVERLPPGLRPQFLNAQVARFRAQLAARRGKAEEADRLFKGAGGLLQELGIPFHLAVARLEHAEFVASERRTDEAQLLLAQASETFERLGAKPWLIRAAGGTRLGHESEAVTADV
jgi:tetratricopeptide (TPR) repeat protein